jgi:glycylpeptide N-tetradecanoyltransferase
VNGLDEKVTDNTYIDPPLEKSQIRQEPYTLPAPYVWSDLDILDDAQLSELYTLLTENYVEDDENMFRFDYSKAFLQWALKPPGWMQKWHVGVRAGSSGRLVSFISAIPCHIRVYEKTLRMVEINFLCVHKKLRSKRVAPVLIKEITRRVNQEGIFQAAFTAGIVIPKPVGSCRYWHRSLNPKKLIETRFSHLSRTMTMARTIKLYKLPEQPRTNLVKMESKHIPSAFKLLTEYLTKFDFVPILTEEEFRHFLLPREDVIYSYVSVNEKDGVVTDLLSFYCLPSSVMNHSKHKLIRAAYAFYSVAKSVPLKQLMHDALILAHNEDFDVFNALDLMENKEFLEELKFGIGDGNLQYYLYNWKCPDMTPERIGLVLQ